MFDKQQIIVYFRKVNKSNKYSSYLNEYQVFIKN